MRKEKKQIIIDEIRLWKKNKMLPHTYCDFLLALYTEGNKKEIKSKNFLTFYSIILAVIALFLPLTLIVIYFTELSFILQMLIVSFFLLLSLIVTIFFYKKNCSIHLSLSVFTILLLISTLRLADYITNGNKLFLSITILVNCMLWIYLSRKFKLIYLLISGVIGLLLILFIYLF